MDDRFELPDDNLTPSPLDLEALERILDLGDESLRTALCDQLMSDFDRLRLAVGSDDGTAVGRAAHELKGLAATIGALRVADMARSLDAVADTLAPAALEAIAIPLQREIDTVLSALETTSLGSAGA